MANIFQQFFSNVQKAFQPPKPAPKAPAIKSGASLGITNKTPLRPTPAPAPKPAPAKPAPVSVARPTVSVSAPKVSASSAKLAPAKPSVPTRPSSPSPQPAQRAAVASVSIPGVSNVFPSFKAPQQNISGYNSILQSLPKAPAFTQPKPQMGPPGPPTDWVKRQVKGITDTVVPKAYADTGEPEPTQPPKNPSESQLTNQAIKNGANPGLLDRAKKFLGSQEYIGLCQAFVERATKGREGIFASAKAAWEQQRNKAQTNMANIKPGDSVYFAPNESNGWYGHTGVYAGNNQFISATYQGVKQIDLNDWIRSTGQKLLGFIPSDDNTGFVNAISSPIGAATSWIDQQVQSMAPRVGKASASWTGTTGGAVSSPSFVNGTPDWVKDSIQKASKKWKIPTILLSGLLKTESGFNPNATSPVGAQGIAQFMPETAQELGIDPSDPDQSIDAAAKYLRQQWDRFGKPELALAAYNAGAGNVEQFGGVPPFKETQNYVKNIMDQAGQVHATAYSPMLDILNNNGQKK